MRLATALLSIFGIAIAGAHAPGAMITYTLLDHPDGNQDPPPYGLRYDDAFAGMAGASGGATTFSFGAAYADAGRDDVTMTIDTTAGTIVIEGEIYGGEDTGATYGYGEGWYDLYFEYTTGVTASGGGWVVDPGDHINNTGWFRSQGNADVPAGTTFNFTDTAMAESFLFLPDGHRLDGDNSSWVGRGWVTDDPNGHDSGDTRDWLFTVVPTPGTLGIAGLGMVAMGVRRRR